MAPTIEVDIVDSRHRLQGAGAAVPARAGPRASSNATPGRRAALSPHHPSARCRSLPLPASTTIRSTSCPPRSRLLWVDAVARGDLVAAAGPRRWRQAGSGCATGSGRTLIFEPTRAYWVSDAPAQLSRRAARGAGPPDTSARRNPFSEWLGPLHASRTMRRVDRRVRADSAAPNAPRSPLDT